VDSDGFAIEMLARAKREAGDAASADAALRRLLAIHASTIDAVLVVEPARRNSHSPRELRRSLSPSQQLESHLDICRSLLRVIMRADDFRGAEFARLFLELEFAGGFLFFEEAFSSGTAASSRDHCS